MTVHCDYGTEEGHTPTDRRITGSIVRSSSGIAHATRTYCSVVHRALDESGGTEIGEGKQVQSELARWPFLDDRE